METNKIEEFLAAHAEHPCSTGWYQDRVVCQECSMGIVYTEAEYRDYLSGLSVPDYLIDIANPF